jgi:hypothetical protein
VFLIDCKLISPPRLHNVGNSGLGEPSGRKRMFADWGGGGARERI